MTPQEIASAAPDSNWISLLHDANVGPTQAEGWLKGAESKSAFLAAYNEAAKTKLLIRDSQRATFEKKRRLFWQRKDVKSTGALMMQTGYYRYRCCSAAEQTRKQDSTVRLDCVRGHPKRPRSDCPAEVVMKEYNRYDQYELSEKTERVLQQLKNDPAPLHTKWYWIIASLSTAHTCSSTISNPPVKRMKRKRKALLGAPPLKSTLRSMSPVSVEDQASPSVEDSTSPTVDDPASPTVEYIDPDWLQVKQSVEELNKLVSNYEQAQVSPSLVYDLATSLQRAVRKFEASVYQADSLDDSMSEFRNSDISNDSIETDSMEEVI